MEDIVDFVIGRKWGRKGHQLELETEMLKILSDSMMIAARQQHWNAAPHWHDSDRTTRTGRVRDRGDLRRWLRQTGIL